MSCLNMKKDLMKELINEKEQQKKEYFNDETNAKAFEKFQDMKNNVDELKT